MRLILECLAGLVLFASAASAGAVMTKPQYGLALDGSSDDIAYLDAFRANTPEAYRNFIEAYPTSEHRHAAFGKMVRGMAGIRTSGSAVEQTGICKDGSCQVW